MNTVNQKLKGREVSQQSTTSIVLIWVLILPHNRVGMLTSHQKWLEEGRVWVWVGEQKGKWMAVSKTWGWRFDDSGRKGWTYLLTVVQKEWTAVAYCRTRESHKHSLKPQEEEPGQDTWQYLQSARMTKTASADCKNRKRSRDIIKINIYKEM